MANPEQLALLKQGVEAWNEWRSGNYETQVDLSHANLPRANLRQVKLIEAKLVGADLSQADLSQANLRNANLINANCSYANLNGAYLRRAKLCRANLSEANLSRAYLSEAYLRGADLSGADLSGAFLTGTQVLATNFDRAILTGACIQEWHFNSATNLNNVICDYIYFKHEYNSEEDSWDFSERRPQSPDKNFNPGEFTKLFQKALETVELIFKDGYGQ